MAVTISLYNHTSLRFANGSNSSSDTYKVMLCTAATFDATNTTLASITRTETTSANGYTAGGLTLTNVTFSTVSTKDAKFDADDAVWSAVGGSIAAAKAILYNSSDTDSPPIAMIDFGGTETAGDGTDFLIIWDSNGIITWDVP